MLAQVVGHPLGMPVRSCSRSAGSLADRVRRLAIGHQHRGALHLRQVLHERCGLHSQLIHRKRILIVETDSNQHGNSHRRSHRYPAGTLPPWAGMPEGSFCGKRCRNRSSNIQTRLAQFAMQGRTRHLITPPGRTQLGVGIGGQYAPHFQLPGLIIEQRRQ